MCMKSARPISYSRVMLINSVSLVLPLFPLLGSMPLVLLSSVYTRSRLVDVSRWGSGFRIFEGYFNRCLLGIKPYLFSGISCQVDG
jgi:hypothetical protein